MYVYICIQHAHVHGAECSIQLLVDDTMDQVFSPPAFAYNSHVPYVGEAAPQSAAQRTFTLLKERTEPRRVYIVPLYSDSVYS